MDMHGPRQLLHENMSKKRRGYGERLQRLLLQRPVSFMLFECAWHFVRDITTLSRSQNLYEKYFVIQEANSVVNGTTLDYESTDVSADAYGARMHGLPFARSMDKFTFCAPPGEYVMHAVDAGDDGWWGGAHYSLLVDGALVAHEEMVSSSKQSTTFTVRLPQSARTSFSKNNAPLGGGGAAFWTDVKPSNLEQYRDGSDSNAAFYGDFVATPKRTLAVRNFSFDAVSGQGMADHPITLEMRDE